MLVDPSPEARGMIRQGAEDPAREVVDASAYLCPRTGSALRQHGSTLRADGGGAEYEVRRGIPQMLRFEPAESEEDKAKLRRLNEIATRGGWREAIEGLNGASDRYNLDPIRSKFLDLLPLTDRSVVLELGPALGLITSNLAGRVGAVHALEVVSEQAEFVAERCRQLGHANVKPACGGDDCRLPYADGLFDSVIFNLVFEWCAQRLVDEPFIDGQRRMLAESFRVLKPGGHIFLATKNRYSLANLIGKPDPHAHGVRFGNALPRWLMAWRMKRRGRARPLGLLHSHDGLRQLLEDAGYVRARSFWAAPEMRFPTDYIPTDPASIRAARGREGFSEGQFRSTRLLMKFIPDALVKHVTPGLMFIAEKPA